MERLADSRRRHPLGKRTIPQGLMSSTLVLSANMERDAKLDLDKLRLRAKECQAKIASLPKWERDAIQYVSYVASSEETRKCLYKAPYTNG